MTRTPRLASYALRCVRRFSVTALLAALALVSCERANQPPSVIVILVDTLRADYLGTYGFEGPISPHIDAFAQESVVFENCFSQAPWTKPSVTSLFTSLQPAVHRVYSHDGKFGLRDRARQTETLAEEALTLAEALKEGGYATAAFVANPWIERDHGFGQGFDVFDTHPRGNDVKAGPVLEAAQEWIAKQRQERPYFAYIHLMDVHGPYNAPEEDYEAVRDSPQFGKEPVPLTPRQIRKAPVYLRRSPWVRTAPPDARVWRARYAANVHALDRRLEPFFQELRRTGVFDSAIIAITSDHGEQLHEHGRWDHGNSLYDEELHVPLIVRLPGGGNGGNRVAAVVSLVDVMPTILALAEVPPVEGLQGRDLSGSLKNGSDALKSVASFATAVKWKPTRQSLRTEFYKLIKGSDEGRGRLYDLRKDPGEQTNIADRSPAFAAVDALLTAQVLANEARGQLEAKRAPMPARVQERLRALGYDVERPTPRGAKRPKP